MKRFGVAVFASALALVSAGCAERPQVEPSAGESLMSAIAEDGAAARQLTYAKLKSAVEAATGAECPSELVEGEGSGPSSKWWKGQCGADGLIVVSDHVQTLVSKQTVKDGRAFLVGDQWAIYAGSSTVQTLKAALGGLVVTG